MRKHFLILMLMALLPYVAWATKPAAKTAPAAASTSFTYTGEPQTLVTAAEVPDGYDTSLGKVFYLATKGAAPTKDNPNWSQSLPEATDAGTYHVYYYLTKDFTASFDEDGDIANVDVTINKRDITASDFTMTGANGLVYDGGSHALLTSFTWTDNVVRGTVQYKVGTTSGGWSAEIPTKADAATYGVRVKIAGDANHNDYTSPTTDDGTWCNVEIAKATPTFTSGAVKTNLTFNAAAQELIETAPTTSVAGTISYNIGGDTWTTASDVKQTNAGDYAITYTFVPTDVTNYNSITEAQELGTAHIEKAVASYSTLATGVTGSLTYNGAELGLVKTGFKTPLGVGSVLWEFAPKGSDSYSMANKYSDVKATNAGTYDVYYTIKADDSGNYKDGVRTSLYGDAGITIGQKTVTVAAKTVSVDWTGEEIDYATTPLYNATGFVAADENSKNSILAKMVKVTITPEEGKKITDAGTHKIVLTPMSGQATNYKPDFMVDESALTIKKVGATLTTAPVAATGLVYDGNAKTLVDATVAAFNGGKLVYSLTETGDYVENTEDLNVKNAGTHSVWCKVQGDNNHNDTAPQEIAGIEIGAAAQSFGEWANTQGFVYGSDAVLPTVTAVNENAKITYQYSDSEDGTYGDAPAEWTKGTWYVKATAAATANYAEATSAAQSFVVTAAAQSFGEWANTQGFVYGSDAVLPTVTAKENPEITYTFKKEGAEEFGGAPAEWTAGTWYVKASAAATANYAAAETDGTQSFVVTAAAQSFGEWANTQGFVYGSDAVLPTVAAVNEDAVITYQYSASEDGTYGAAPEVWTKGTWYVKATAAATANYAEATSEAQSFVVTAAAQSFGEWANTQGFVYGSAAVLPTVAAVNENAVITYQYSASEDGTYGAAPEVWTKGTWYVKATAAATANYAEATSAAQSFVVAAAAQNFGEWANTQGFVYGSDAVLPTVTAEENPEITYTFKKEGAEEFGGAPAEWTAGTWYVKASAAATANYAAAETDGTQSFEVSKADVVATAPQALALTYNGAAQNLVTAGEATGAEIQFLNGEEWTTAIPQETNAGAYTVQYKYVADANHNEKAGGEIAVNIQKSNLKFELGNKDADWTGEQIPAEGAYILSVGALQGQDQIGEEGAFSLAFPDEVINAGTYNFNQLKPTFNGAENYTILFSGNAEVKVNAVDIVAADFKAPAAVEDALIFNGKAQDLFVAGEMVHNYGEIQYSADGETWSAELTDALKQGTAAAEYKLFYKVVSDGNHNDFVAEAPLTKTIAAKAWDPYVVAFLEKENLEYTYATEQAKGYDFMPAAADLVLIDGTGKNKKILTADDYELKITSTKVDEETGEAIVATQAINADTYTFTYTGKGNYAGNVKEYTLTINKKEIEDVFALNAETAEYTSENQIGNVEVTKTLDELVAGTDYTVEKPAEAINKGQYDVTITLGENYTFADAKNTTVKTFEITPAQILITAGDVEKIYDGEAGLNVAGADALEPELSYAGLKKNDKIADVITNVAEGAVTVTDAAAAVNSYALAVDLSKFTVAEGNYTVKANDVQGKLTINKRDLTITFADRDEEDNYLISKAYGAEDNFADVDALVELDNNVAADAEAIIAGITVSRSNADVNAVGKYDGVLEIATEGDVFANYNVTATDKGDFEITAGKLTIALKTSTGKVYDGAAPEASWTVAAADLAVTGMKESDKIADIFTTMPTATIQAPAAAAGTYVIKLDGAVTPNYEIAGYLDGQYIITPKALTATVDAQTVQIDAEELPHPAAFVINGAVKGDELNAQLSINASTATAGVFAQGIELTIDNDNYTLPATYGELTVIDPAAVAQFDVKDADVFDAIKAAEGATTANITGREVASKEWIAFILPFDVTVEQLCDVFGYSIINTYDAKNSSASHMKFQIEQEGVPANTPFIIKPKKAYAADKNMTFEEVVVKAPASAKVEIEVGGNTFVGQYEEFTIVKKDVPNSTYLRAGGWKRAKNSDRVIEPFDCYITWPEGVEAPSISIEDEGGVTKIATITTDGRIIEAEGWYTVNGMKLDAAPTEKGVYIKDGKKVVIK